MIISILWVRPVVRDFVVVGGKASHRLLLEPETTLTLRDLAHPIEFVPEKLPAHELLDVFLQKRMHLVALRDEYGGFDGLITLEDVLESLLGQEIVDEHDEVRITNLPLLETLAEV